MKSIMKNSLTRWFFYIVTAFVALEVLSYLWIEFTVGFGWSAFSPLDFIFRFLVPYAACLVAFLIASFIRKDILVTLKIVQLFLIGLIVFVVVLWFLERIFI